MAMVFALLKFEEEKGNEQKTTEFYSQNVEQFLKTAPAKKLQDEYAKKGFTKRGVSKLLRLIWPLYKSDASALKNVKDLLASLKGEDGLGKLLSVLKLVPEGIFK